MIFLERLAEQKIRRAIERGELDNLRGAGAPIPPEPEMDAVAPELRMAYRLLKNAGFVPEEVRLRREIHDAHQLLAECGETGPEQERARKRLQLLLRQLGELRGVSLSLDREYERRLWDRLDRNHG